MGESVRNRDRRSYPRIFINIDACAFIEDLEDEIVCKLLNISEYGLCAEFDPFEGFRDHLHKGVVMTMQFVDSFYYGQGMESDVISIKCNIRYVEETGRKIIIGCAVDSDDYKKYVEHKQLSWMFRKNC